jgi:hypothetical protein
MPHGDFSDLAALVMLAGGFQQMFYPTFQLPDPVKPFPVTMTGDTEFMVRFCGGFLVILGCMLFTVRWNTINGKLSGLACIGCAANIGYLTFQKLDTGAFVPRVSYIYSVVLLLCGLHLMFNANPLPGKDKKN